MRVLEWLNTFLPDTGGIQTFCADLLPELRDRGHEIVILTAHSADDMADRDVHQGIEVVRVDSRRALLDRDPAAILRAKKQIQSLVTELGPDVVHVHPCGPELPYFLDVQRRTPIPTLLTLHNNYEQMGVALDAASSFGRALDVAARIATVSHDARDWLLSERPDLADRTVTVHNGIPDLPAPPPPPPWDPPVLLFVGRIEPQKRIDVLVDAFAEVARIHPDVRLRVVGDGTELPAVRARVEQLGLADRVELPGRVDPGAVPRLLDEATATVLSSDYEGLPIAVLEAARHGRPVVSTDAGGVREVVIDGVGGLLVPPADPPALAAALVRLLDDREAATRWAGGARARFVEAFSIDTCATSYERLLAETVATAGDRGR